MPVTNLKFISHIVFQSFFFPGYLILYQPFFVLFFPFCPSKCLTPCICLGVICISFQASLLQSHSLCYLWFAVSPNQRFKFQSLSFQNPFSTTLPALINHLSQHVYKESIIIYSSRQIPTLAF